MQEGVVSQRPDLRFMGVHELKAHEQIKRKKAEHLLRHMRKTRIMPKPILVDAATGVILDGHHRYWACRELGVRQVPCCMVDYLSDERITVEPRRPNVTVTKQEVIRRGLAGELYPPKSSKHLQDIPQMETPYPLSALV